jgi:hypothetical protein
LVLNLWIGERWDTSSLDKLSSMVYTFTWRYIMEEIWKSIKGFEGLYEVSNLGNVRRLDSITSNGHYWKGRVLKLKNSTNGYSCISLFKSGEEHQYRVHRLVAKTFIKNTHNLPVVNHKDGNKKNNKEDNLEWTTKIENERHSVKIGTTPVGSKTHSSKLIEEDILQIFSMNESGMKQVKIAQHFNVHPSHISRILSGDRNYWRIALSRIKD